MPEISSRASDLTLLAIFVIVGSFYSAHAQVPSTAEPLAIDNRQEEKLLNMVTAPDGFDVQLFAVPPVNYPAAITATPDGDLFVAIDRNGSLDRERGRGQIYRVMDMDNDGQGDYYSVYVDSVDSPRGLVYDGKQLYVMHPPDLTVYRDTDDDGAADTSRTLVRGLGRTLDFRGADHTTNGMQVGIDGWLYISVGDYGFDEAVGTDGRRIRYRGGAVVRVRPDGSDLEIYARGLRNSYDITLDPYLNGFVRGNTNDGLGWDVRLNQILPLADYGYPDLYLNFQDEIMPPLADYGGGSGTGALYVDTPDLPEPYGRTLYTVDWGVSQVFRHPLQENGVQFEAEQEPFLQIPQPTDITIDGRSNLYVSSWFGATFTYAGPDAGFIVRLRPEEGTSSEVPQFQEASSEQLIELIASSNQLYRLHAQHEILRRGTDTDISNKLIELAHGDQPAYVRAAAIFTLKQLEGPAAHDELLALTDDPEVGAFALRALADRRPQNVSVPVQPFLEALHDGDPRVRLEAINGLVRLDAQTSADEIIPLTADPDRAVREVAVNALTALNAVETCLNAAVSGSSEEAGGALEALRYMHTAQTVSGLLDSLTDTIDDQRRIKILIALGRLYHREAKWNGTDWWGTQPNPRGPYFEPTTWHQSAHIKPVLRRALLEHRGFQLVELANGLELNRALPDSSADLIVRAAETSESLHKNLVEALVGHHTVRGEAADVLETASDNGSKMYQAVIELLVAQTEVPEEAFNLLQEASLNDQFSRDLREQIVDVLSRSSPQ